MNLQEKKPKAYDLVVCSVFAISDMSLVTISYIESKW